MAFSAEGLTAGVKLQNSSLFTEIRKIPLPTAVKAILLHP
jgi:hypothetical protein